jgi:hypothetical protein
MSHSSEFKEERIEGMPHMARYSVRRESMRWWKCKTTGETDERLAALELHQKQQECSHPLEKITFGGTSLSTFTPKVCSVCKKHLDDIYFPDLDAALHKHYQALTKKYKGRTEETE